MTIGAVTDTCGRVQFRPADAGQNRLRTHTGPGIPENIRDKVFHLFFTTKEVGKGTG